MTAFIAFIAFLFGFVVGGVVVFIYHDKAAAAEKQVETGFKSAEAQAESTMQTVASGLSKEAKKL